MRKLVKILTVALLLTIGISLYARMGIQISLNRTDYMKFEHIFACVTLRNDSGRPLLFGSDPALQGFLMFEIRDHVNRPVAKRAGADISVTGLMLAPGEVKKIVFQLDRHYQLGKTGNYRVHAYISHNLLKHEYKSKDVSFSISDGVEVWKRTVGLPDLDGRKDTPVSQERTYSIRMLDGRHSNSYYLMVEDDNNIYGVVKVGQKIGYEKFQAQVDMLSRIHLLMPITPKIFHYLAFNSAGETLESSYWKSAGTIPSLHYDTKNGSVIRTGGIPARPGRDFPNPNLGAQTVSEIIGDGKRTPPKARRDSGLVDLGVDEMPQRRR